MKIAFDVDGTLIHENIFGMPMGRAKVTDLLLKHKAEGNYIIVWSKGGKRHAKKMCRSIGIDKFVDEYMHKVSNPGGIDICYDNQEVDLADMNILI